MSLILSGLLAFAWGIASSGAQPAADADLRLEKSDSSDPAQANSQLTYTITVTNDGPSDAQDVEITDPLPSGTAFVSVSGPGTCTVGSSDISCSLATLSAFPPTNTAVWTITVQVEQVGSVISDGVVLSNSAQVTSSTNDPGPGENSDTESTTIAAPVLELTKSADPPEGSIVSPGETITYTIDYANTGSGNATNFNIVDTVSEFLGDVTPANGGTYDPDSRVITWVVGDVLGGASGSVSFTARVGSVDKSRDIANTAEAIAGELSTAIESNRVEHSLDPPDVRVEKTADRSESSEVKPGDVVTYRISVRNREGGRANGVRVTDDPPPYMSYVPGSTAVDGASVSDSGGTSLLFGPGMVFDLRRNDSVLITFKMIVDVAAPAGGVLQNWGYASWNLGNDRSGDFHDLRVFRPRVGPTLRQSVVIQGPTGRTIFVTIFNRGVPGLPVTGYQSSVLVLLALSSIGMGRSLASRLPPDLFRRKRDE